MSDEAIVNAVLAGDRRAIARALSEVERDPLGQLSAALYAHAGKAHIVGVTGSPGSGKSTLASALIAALRARGRTVGVVAVDPSSPFTGGAILGDRVRMAAHAGDGGVFIRSMASRGGVGGLALATADAVRVLDASGFDFVLVETVGAGQAEVDIAAEAHTTIVVLVPGLGDDVQAIKAGILEIADIYAVNKSDLAGADRVVASLKMMLGIGMRGREVDWMPPVLCTVATSGQGAGELADAIEAHGRFMRESGAWEARVRERAAADLRRLLHARLVTRLLDQGADGQVEALLDRLVSREIDPRAAAEELIAARSRPPRRQ